MNVLVGDEYPIGVYECDHGGKVIKFNWNWCIAGELADADYQLFVSTQDKAIVVERLTAEAGESIWRSHATCMQTIFRKMIARRIRQRLHQATIPRISMDNSYER